MENLAKIQKEQKEQVRAQIDRIEEQIDAMSSNEFDSHLHPEILEKLNSCVYYPEMNGETVKIGLGYVLDDMRANPDRMYTIDDVFDDLNYYLMGRDS